MYPKAINFTRSQISELTGLSDSVLAFWLKRSVIKPTTKSEGTGRHLKFDFIEIHLAALLRELRKLGNDVDSLKAFADLVHQGRELAERYRLSENDLSAACEVGLYICRFREGEAVTVYPEGAIKGQLATSEQDIILHVLEWEKNSNPTDNPNAVAELGKTLSRRELLALGLYHELHWEDHLVVRGAGEERGSSWEEWMWVCWQENGEWNAATGAGASGIGDRFRDFDSAIMLSVSRIIRGIWKK